MEKISDFFKEFKDRLSNPFFVSFIIAWLIYNWKIVVGLTMYKTSELCLDGYKSYIDLILKNSNHRQLFCIPLYWALGYTFIYPFVKNFILVFDALIKTWGDKGIFWATKEGKVSMTKYLESRETSEKMLKSLEEVIVKESEYRDQNTTLNADILTLKASKIDLEDKLGKWESYNNVKTLNGDWQLKRTIGGVQQASDKDLFINDGLVSEYIDDARNKRLVGEIMYYHFNINSFELSFSIIPRGIESHELTIRRYVLKATEKIDNLKGIEEGVQVNIEFIKK